MNRIFRRRPSPAMGVALVALFISLSGVSYGVATGFIDSREIQNKTILSKDIRNSTIRTEDLRNNEVRGFDIRNSTIRSADVALNTLIGADIDESKLGKVPSRDQRRQSRHRDKATTPPGPQPGRIRPRQLDRRRARGQLPRRRRQRTSRARKRPRSASKASPSRSNPRR